MCAAEPEYAEKLIKHARQMLEFGLAHPGSYMTSKQEGLKDHSKHYPSSNYNDEMAWGALWLHLATEVRVPLGAIPLRYVRRARRGHLRLPFPPDLIDSPGSALPALTMLCALSSHRAAWGLTAIGHAIPVQAADETAAC